MNKYTVTTKKIFQQEPLYVVILASDLAYRAKTYGNPILTNLGNVTLLEHQLSVIRHTYPNAIVSIVVGFQADRVIKYHSDKLNIIENVSYETLGKGEDIRLYLNSCWPSRVLFIDGAISFCERTVRLLTEKPSIFTYNSDDERQVGVFIENEKVEHLSYGLPEKFSGLCYLEGTSLSSLKKIANRDNNRLLLFELLNKMIEKNVEIKAINDNTCEIVKF